MFRTHRKNRRPSNTSNAEISYDRLEQRNLLSVSASFADGTLFVELTEPMDVATISTTLDFVTVNGFTVDGSSEPGNQMIVTDDIERISIDGNGLTDVSVNLGLQFNSGNLQDIIFSDINQFSITGLVDVANDIQGTLSGNDGFFGGNGPVQIGGQLQLTAPTDSAADFDVSLLNPNNDFNQVSIQSNGDIELADTNDIQLDDTIADNLNVSSLGAITQVAGASITVNVHSELTADSVDLGFDGEVDLSTLTANTAGLFALDDASSIDFQFESNLGSAVIRSANIISMGEQASLEVIGDARFVAPALFLGEGNLSTFNTGRISFSAVHFSIINEDSSLQIFGRDNFLLEGGLIAADGLLSASRETIFRADSREFVTTLESTGDIILGNREEGRIVIRELNFSGDFVRLTLDGTINLNGSNSADRLRLNLRRANPISDAPGTRVSVRDNATFIVDSDQIGSSVILGDSPTDFFQAGTVSFSVPSGRFQLSEIDRTVITSENGTFANAAEFLNLTSGNDLINDAGSRINVTRNASLSGDNIALGQASSDDFVNLRGVNVSTPGLLVLDLDGGIDLIGTNNVGATALVIADGNLRQFSGTLNVAGQTTTLIGSRISATGLSTNTLRFVSSGSVNITHNGDLRFSTSTNSADNAFFRSTGSISNSNGNLNITNSLRLRAQNDIFLAAGRIGSLNFQTPGSVTIFSQASSNNNLFVFGSGDNRNQAREFRLDTSANVRDGINTIIEVDELFEIDTDGIVVLGESMTDCLAIPADAVFNASNGNSNVTIDSSCPT